MVKKIVLSIVVFIIGFIVVVGIINRDKIELIYTGYFMSADELRQRTEKAQNELIKTLEEEYGIEDIREVIIGFDEEKILRGEITIEDIKKAIEQRKQKNLEKRKEHNSGKVNGEEFGQSAENQEICKTAVEDAINEIYLLKAQYLSKLGGTEKEIVNYYNSLMRQEGMTKSKAKLSVADNYTERMLTFQKECDNSVSSILTNLETILKENGGDTAIISQIQTEYENVKKEKLNYYMSIYNKK